LDEYDVEEEKSDDRVVEEEHFDGCRTKDKASIGEIDSGRDRILAIPEPFSHTVRQTRACKFL